jgi:hypothetical protein
VDGKKLATYTYTIVESGGSPEIQLNEQSSNVYLAGMLLTSEGNRVTTDRLGSVRSGGPGGLGYQAQYPYGVEYTTTANDREKYATYTRDSLTGPDYAVNRYYWSQWGRFLSPDPYANSAGPTDPGPTPTPGTPGGGGGGAGSGGGYAPCTEVAGIWMDPFFRPCGSGSGVGGRSSSHFPKCNPGGSTIQNNNLQFVADNYSSAQALSQTYGVPTDWILGWAALEPSTTSPQGNWYGTVPQAQSGDNNFFGMTAQGWTGQTQCLVSVTNSSGATFACFASFSASANAALTSKYGSILSTDASAGDTASQAFTAVYAAGWDRANPAQAGAFIQSTIKNHIVSMLSCLLKNGYI